MIIENNKQFEYFIEEYKKSNCILIPILSDINNHPIKNRLSILYIKLLNGGAEYILPFNHIDSINLPYEYLYELNFNNTKYVYNKKQLNHIIKLDNVIDINLLYYMESNEPLDISELQLNIYKFYINKFYKFKNINDIIPLMKHIEYCKKFSDILQEFVHMKPFVEYNDVIIDTLYYIESSGMQTITNRLYSEYNIYTTTGRPSNSYGGINFAALNKTDGTRKQFISRFKDGILVEFDYDAFHVRLLSNLVNIKLPQTSAHEYLMKQYGITDYKEAKELTFKYLYGNIPEDIQDNIPFFKEVQKYIDNLWNSYKSNNFIKSTIYRKRIYKNNLHNMNKNKLFNYILQLTEFECSIKAISKLLPLLENYRSKLILYTYDSILFDYNKRDGKEFIYNIKNIIEQNGAYPTKISIGYNYHNMEKFNGMG